MSQVGPICALISELVLLWNNVLNTADAFQRWTLDKYELKWDNFGESLIRGLQSEKSRGDFVDVCIAVSGGEVIHAHKLVLILEATKIAVVEMAMAVTAWKTKPKRRAKQEALL